MFSLATLSGLGKALSDSNRLRLWALVADGDVCACHLTACLDLAAATVSQHLSVLRAAGLVTARQEGKWRVYRAVALCAESESLLSGLVGDPTVQDDRQRLRAIVQASARPASCV